MHAGREAGTHFRGPSLHLTRSLPFPGCPRQKRYVSDSKPSCSPSPTAWRTAPDTPVSGPPLLPQTEGRWIRRKSCPGESGTQDTALQIGAAMRSTFMTRSPFPSSPRHSCVPLSPHP